MPDPSAPSPAAAAVTLPEQEESLRAELIAALDHDLRTSLTTVLGALQTLARPDLAPADPDLAELLSSALAQAQRIRRLLDELPGAASPGPGRPLAAAELAYLIRAAAEAADGAVEVEVPAGLPPVRLSAAGLRRALAGILAKATAPAATRVVVAAHGPDCRITITREGDGSPSVSTGVGRLVAAMGGRTERTGDDETPGICLIFPADWGALPD